MGTWGYGLFADDVAADVRMMYEQALKDGVTDREATARVLEKFSSHISDPDEGPLIEIALAVTQWTWAVPIRRPLPGR
ncbi:MAG TPA: hypothetical protein VES67_09930 [Vicinamibacterales bacterium]|nr:hypothetical protein [Vicinamibacterales bacterium]